jgi:2',3'-cyclic-nucleotide 2'-phosphodiesterase (5'-nucleotidase family)
MLMPAATTIPYGRRVTTTNLGWDLDATDGLSDIPTGNTVVYLRITGIQQDDFLQLNNILDGGTSLAKSHPMHIDTTQPPILASLVAGGGGGPPPSNSTTRGRVKYNTRTQTVLIHLAHSP